MFLVLGFLPGEAVEIAGRRFTIDHATRTLTDDLGNSFQLSDLPVVLAANVSMQLPFVQRWPGKLSIAFDATPDVTIIRQSGVAGDAR